MKSILKLNRPSGRKLELLEMRMNANKEFKNELNESCKFFAGVFGVLLLIYLIVVFFG